MTKFWVRMSQLFTHKFLSAEGEHIDNQGEYSSNFKRWCEELKKFTDKDWTKAYKRIEDDIKAAAHEGKDLWPPSSLAVIAYAEPVIASQMYKAFDRSAAVEDLTAKEERYRRGQEESSKLLSMFD